MRILKMLVSSLALLLSVTVVLLGCDGDNGTGGSGGGGGGNTNVSGNGNKCGVDGTAKSCKTVVIGDQTWMAENLNRKTDSSWCYADSNSMCDKYGRLYAWNAAKKACPSGWKLPESADIDKLLDIAGGWRIAGSKLKSTSGWNDFCGFNGNEPCINGNGTDDFGFSALPGGRTSIGWYISAGSYGFWWMATEYENPSYAQYFFMSNNMDDSSVDHDSKSYLKSVRCLKTD
jgi:uncharacterized protein (TIGR02145 family)